MKRKEKRSSEKGGVCIRSLRLWKKLMGRPLTGWNGENCVPGWRPATAPLLIRNRSSMRMAPRLTSSNGIAAHDGSRSQNPLRRNRPAGDCLTFTDRRADHGSLEETRKFLRDAQTFLGCEILPLMDFLKEKGLLYEYLRYKDPAYQTGEEELPF